MKEQVLPKQARVLLENFESAFSETWLVAQFISEYINDVYRGDKNEFLNAVSRNCDYYSSADILRFVFEYSEK